MNKIFWPGQGQTREGRAKNVFGLSTCSYTKMFGAIGEDNEKGDHLAIFKTEEDSIHAAIRLIREHYLFLGFMRPEPFGNKWSGDPLKKYGEKLAEVAKLFPFSWYRFNAVGDGFLKALAIMENGNPVRDIPAGYFEQFVVEDN